MKHNDLFKLVAVLALLTMIVLTGCVVVTPEAVTTGGPAVTEQTVTEAELEAQIGEAVWVYEEAYQAGELERIMALYTDDVVSLPPGFPKTEGKADLEAAFQEFFDTFTIERDFELVDVDVFGDTATRLGEWTQTLTPKDGGEPIVETGRCILGYKKVGDEWQVAWEIWNTESVTVGEPAAPEEAAPEMELPGQLKTTADGLSGIWLNRTGFGGCCPAYLQFNQDGSYRVAGTLYLENHPSEVGQFQLEGTSLIFLPSDESPSCAGQAGRYQLELTEHGHLRFQVQDDPCRTRAEVNDELFVRLLTVEDLVGIWDSGEELYLQFNADGSYRAANSLDSLENVPSEVGSYQLQEGAYPPILTLTTNDESPFCQGQIGTYEAKLVKGQLQFELQEDTCRDRAIDLAAMTWDSSSF